MAANGHIEPEINAVQQDITFAQKPQVFRNRQGQLVDVGDRAGIPFTEPIVARGIASADIDHDGDLDLLFTTNGGPAKLLRNEAESTHWLRLRLQGKTPNVQAIGATVTVWSNSLAQHRMVRTGSSYLTQSDLSTLVFGLGEATQADSILVRWPTSGEISKLRSAQSGETYVIAEGATDLKPAG